MRSLRALVPIVVLLLTGCASFVASPGDYASYRATRTAADLDERMRAVRLYLERHPEGAFASEVSSFYERAEPLYFEARKSTIAGLRAYLEALPDGPHAEEARTRLSALIRRESR